MDLSIREDEFSVQYLLKSDPAFWIRLVKPIGDTLCISDALQGSLSEEELEAALTEVLTIHASETVHSIIFADIAPDLSSKISDKRLVAERFDLLSTIAKRWAQKAGRQLENSYLDIRYGKFGAIFKIS